MAVVSLDDVTKSFGAVQAIHGVSIQIEDGQFVVLVGPSGCGKSTLLRMIAGLEDVSGGAIAIDGRVINDMEPKDRDIAMVFQSYALYPHMTVSENMGFSLEMAREARPDITTKVRKVAAVLGLDVLLDRLPKQLSGGQRQRVAMGRAITRDPQVFLFDEPLSNLDAKLRVQMRNEIKKLHQRLGSTMIYVTHDQIEAMTMADKIVVMRDGVVEQSGTPLDLYDRPRSIFVASFIGSPTMNFLDGVAERDGTRSAVRIGDQTFPLPPKIDAPAGKALTLGIRPQKLTLGDEGLPATVSLVEPTGSETYAYLTTDQGNLTLVSQDRLALSPGEQVHLKMDAGAMHVFDAATQLRL